MALLLHRLYLYSITNSSTLSPWLPCTVDSRTVIPTHRRPCAVPAPPLTLSLHGPQLQLCCCVGQVLFYLEKLILLNFALLLQLIHLKENYHHKGFSFPVSRESWLYRMMGRDTNNNQSRGHAYRAEVSNAQVPLLSLGLAFLPRFLEADFSHWQQTSRAKACLPDQHLPANRIKFKNP